ncbi:hypothetical protein INR49_032467, partial [Caranx melampygus]
MERHMVWFALLLCITVASSGKELMLFSTVTDNEGGHERRGMKSSLPAFLPEVSEKAASYRAAASSQTCEPKAGNDNQWFHVKEMLIGCWTDFVAEDKTEVHIVHFQSSLVSMSRSITTNVQSWFFSLNFSTANPMKLILTSAVTLTGFYTLNSDVDLYLANNSTITLRTNGPSQREHMENFPSQDEELVRWAEEKFGGVTSFTTLRNVVEVKSTEMKGTKSGSSKCLLQSEDASRKNFMETLPTPQAMSFSSCSPQQQNPGEPELHIINIPETARVCNISLNMDVKDHEKTIKMYLRGPQGTTWILLNPSHTKCLSNNDVLWSSFNHRVRPNSTLNSDNAEEVQRKALTEFKVSTFTSYTEVRPESCAILLDLVRHEKPTVSTPVTVNTPNDPQEIFMQLYASPDYRSPLDPNTKVPRDKRIYAEISAVIYGDMVWTIKVISCAVRSKGLFPVVKGLPFIPEACSLNSCPNSTRLSFSLDHLQELTSTTWEVECAVKMCYNVEGLQADLVATIRSNGPQGRAVKSFVFPKGNGELYFMRPSVVLRLAPFHQEAGDNRG